MSAQTVFDFWDKARQDQGLQAKLTALQEQDPPAALISLLQIAREAGFRFTAEDYQEAVKKKLARQHQAGPLSEEQLSGVAAGCFPSARR
jgi:predicted ribosomally synthesized peptide with nif11-like leader